MIGPVCVCAPVCVKIEIKKIVISSLVKNCFIFLLFFLFANSKFKLNIHEFVAKTVWSLVFCQYKTGIVTTTGLKLQHNNQ